MTDETVRNAAPGEPGAAATPDAPDAAGVPSANGPGETTVSPGAGDPSRASVVEPRPGPDQAPGADEAAPGQQQPEAADDSAEGVDAELAALAERAMKADEYLALAQRTQADFENYRKRATREAASAKERGVAKLAKELLPAVDNLDRALVAAQAAAAQAGEGDEIHAQLVSGVSLVQADMLSAFGRAGIEVFSPEGEPFDPQWHEAVAQAPVEGAVSGTVVEVYQRGYKLGDAVLRPARVLVAA